MHGYLQSSTVHSKLSFCFSQRPSGTESETEEELLISMLNEQVHSRYPFDEIESNASHIE